MDELVAADMEDWSLQAIVRGSSGDFAKIVDVEMDGGDSFLDISATHDGDGFDGEFLASFPEIFEVSSIGNSSEELEELYKPFVKRSLPAAQSSFLDFQEQVQPSNVIVEDKRTAHDQSDQSSSANSCVARVSSGYTPKYKKRKNQHKRVVVQVSVEGLASDMWAWRKYGQKPIKGSPYPRSYYRCSSSKGCLARKQVEQSCTDPEKFIITYTAEHSHSQPTRRNSLAGTVRQKFPSPSSSSSPKTPNINRRAVKLEKIEHELSSSPETLHQQTRIIKQEVVKQESGQRHDNDYDDHDFMMMSDDQFVFNEDFFSGLEEFDQFHAEVPSCHASAHDQFPVKSCTSWF